MAQVKSTSSSTMAKKGPDGAQILFRARSSVKKDIANRLKSHGQSRHHRTDSEIPGPVPKGFADFEERFNVPSSPIQPDDFVVGQTDVGAQQRQPFPRMPASIADKHELDRQESPRSGEVHHNRSLQLMTTPGAAQGPINLRQREEPSLPFISQGHF